MTDIDFEAIVADLKAKSDNRTAQEEADHVARMAKLEADDIEKATRSALALVEAWGVPRRIRDGIARLSDTKALVAVRRWHADRIESSWCIVLSADKGVGKSTAAGWWLSQMSQGRERGPQTSRCWWPASELAAADSYGDGFDDLATARQLVIDDLGVEFNDTKGAFASKLDRLLDARYREYRPTVITTNLAAAAFSQRYGERVYDRLCEGGIWVSIAGTSMRRSA